MRRLAVLLAVLAVPCMARSIRADEPVSYARDVVPFLEEHCLACHDVDFETSDLSLHSVEAMLRGGRRGPAIVPGKGADSLLIQFLTGKRQPQMPPKTSIPLDQVERLARWIDQGAKVDEADALLARRAEARKAAAEEAAAFASDAPPPVTGLSFAADGKVLAVASDREVILVDPADGKTLRRLAGFPDQVTAVAFKPDGKLLAAAGGAPGKQGEVRVWETEHWAEVRVLRGHDDTALALAWRPGTDQLATSSLDKLIIIWDVESGRPVRTIRNHADIVGALAYSADGKRLASGSADKTAKIYDAETGTQTASLATHREAVLAVAFSPDGQHLATAGEDRGIALWKLDNLNNPQRGFGHTGPVYALAWRPDGASIWAGAGGRPSLLSFRKENGNRDINIDEATMSPDWVYAVAVAPDGHAVAAGGWDGAVILWGLADGKPLRRLIPGRDD